MNYFVTGGTGFIGRFVVERLLQRSRSTVYLLVRKESKAKFEALRDSLGADPARLLPMWGDITTPGLVSRSNFNKLKGKLDHLYHLAAVYDLNMDDETGDRVNNEGTRNVVEFANAIGGKVSLQHMSSVAVAGGHFRGVFKENMFDEGQDTSHPYYRTKFESERIVREECQVPWRVYRPGAVVGSSVTGEMDKIDGPYYLFPTIKTIVDTVPKWLPLLGIEGGKIPIVPVDYVADATVAIAHKPKLDGKLSPHTYPSMVFSLYIFFLSFFYFALLIPSTYGIIISRHFQAFLSLASYLFSYASLYLSQLGLGTAAYIILPSLA